MTKIVRLMAPVLLVLSVVLTGCAAPEAAPAQTPRPTAAEKTPAATESPALAPAAGTRENPIPIDTITEYSPQSQWQFSVGPTNADATAQVLADGGVTPPEEGFVFVLAPFYVKVKETGSVDGSSPGGSLDINYVSTAGNSYPTGGVSCYGVGHLYGVGDMYPSAESTASICASVPADAVIGGNWKVTSRVAPGDSIFLTGAR